MVTNLSDKQLTALKHIGDFQISLTDFIDRACFSGQSRNATRRCLRKLNAKGLIDSAPLFGNYRYYHLTKAAAPLLAQDSCHCGPLGPTALAERFGILLFAFGSSPFRRVLPDHEFRTHFPNLATLGLQHSNYYLDDDGERRLGYVFVDRGTTPGNIVRKVREKIVGPRRAIPDWHRQFFSPENEAFALSVVTFSSVKAKLIEEELQAEPMLQGVRLGVVHFEELRLTLSLKRSRQKRETQVR